MKFAVTFGVGEHRKTKVVEATSPENAADKATGFNHTRSIRPLLMQEGTWVGRWRKMLEVIITRVEEE